MATQETTVLIIGAGPTGLTLANELALNNIPLRIIDKKPVRATQSRALVVQPRSLELLNRYGDSVRTFIDARGSHIAGAAIFVNRRRVYDIEMRDLGLRDTSFPLPVVISQAVTEQFLEDRLAALGHVVERPLTTTTIEQDADGATATITDGNTGQETKIRAQYIVGCDGAHSTVRHQAGLAFPGSPYQQSFLLADLHVDWDGPHDRLSLFLGQGVLAMFPLPDGVWRVVASPRVPSRPMAEDETPTLEDFQDLWQRFGSGGSATLRDPIWLARFRLHHRGVERYRSGRLLVAGDAAHIHSPAGGQGMNTGIQDAANLGWKLALVLRGERPPAFLDSYHDERWPVGQRLLHGTDAMFRYAATTSWLVAALRNLILPWVLPWVAGTAARRASLFRFVSQLGVRYRRSNIVRTANGWTGVVRGGDRAPDGMVRDGVTGEEGWLLDLCRGCRYHLLLFAGKEGEVVAVATLRQAAERFRAENTRDHDVGMQVILSEDAKAPSDAAALVDVEGRLHARYGFGGPGLVYVRPDGYVEWIGPLAALNDLLLGLREVSGK